MARGLADRVAQAHPHRTRAGRRLERRGGGTGRRAAPERAPTAARAVARNRRRDRRRRTVLSLWGTSAGHQPGRRNLSTAGRPAADNARRVAARHRGENARRIRLAGPAGRAAIDKEGAVHRLWGFCALCWSPQELGLANDFEGPVFRRYPRLDRIRRELLKRGAAEAALAGSGSAVFGVFRNPAQARRAARSFPEDQVFLCATLSRNAYARAFWGGVGMPGQP